MPPLKENAQRVQCGGLRGAALEYCCPEHRVKKTLIYSLLCVPAHFVVARHITNCPDYFIKFQIFTDSHSVKAAGLETLNLMLQEKEL